MSDVRHAARARAAGSIVDRLRALDLLLEIRHGRLGLREPGRLRRHEACRTAEQARLRDERLRGDDACALALGIRGTARRRKLRLARDAELLLEIVRLVIDRLALRRVLLRLLGGAGERLVRGRLVLRRARQTRERDRLVVGGERALRVELGTDSVARGLGLLREAKLLICRGEGLRCERLGVAPAEAGTHALRVIHASDARGVGTGAPDRREREREREGRQGQHAARPHRIPPSRAGGGGAFGVLGLAAPPSATSAFAAALVRAGCSFDSRSVLSSCARKRPLWAMPSSRRARSRSATIPASVAARRDACDFSSMSTARRTSRAASAHVFASPSARRACGSSPAARSLRRALDRGPRPGRHLGGDVLLR